MNSSGRLIQSTNDPTIVFTNDPTQEDMILLFNLLLILDPTKLTPPWPAFATPPDHSQTSPAPIPAAYSPAHHDNAAPHSGTRSYRTPAPLSANHGSPAQSSAPAIA